MNESSIKTNQALHNEAFDGACQSWLENPANYISVPFGTPNETGATMIERRNSTISAVGIVRLIYSALRTVTATRSHLNQISRKKNVVNTAVTLNPWIIHTQYDFLSETLNSIKSQL